MSRFTIFLAATLCLALSACALPLSVRQAIAEGSPEATVEASSDPSPEASGDAGDTRGGSFADASASPEAGDSCFPADAMVQLANGGAKPMAELEVGDVVHVGKGKFSEVFMFTHRVAGGWSEFVEMSSKSGAVLRASSGHYVYVNGDLSAAKSVVAGDEIELADGTKDVVVKVSTVQKQGLFNPQTIDGSIVVDGVLASTFTTAVEPAFAHAILSPLRSLYRVFGAFPSVFDNGASSNILSMVPSGPTFAY
jgi:desert hedgehog